MTITPVQPLPGSLLAPADSDFETWSGNWVAGGSNTTAAQSAAQAFTGSNSMGLTATAAGSVIGNGPHLNHVIGSAGVILSCYAYTATSGCTATLNGNWYTSGGTSISNSTGTAVSLTAGAWTPVTAALSSPSNAAMIKPGVTITGLGASQLVNVDLVYVAVSWAQFLAAWYTQPGASAPLWADITPWVRADKGVTTSRGRDDEVSDSQAGKLTFTADNSAGWFSIGNTGSPWYPNVLLGRRVQVNRPDETGAWHTRADQYLTDLPVGWQGGPAKESLVQCAASGLLASVGRAEELRTMLEQEILLDSPMCFYTLADPSGSETASDSSGSGAAPLVLRAYGSGGTLTFGNGTAIVEAGTLNGTSPITSISCTPHNTGPLNSEQSDLQLEGFLPAPVTAAAGFTVEIWSSGVDFVNNTNAATWYAIGVGNPRTGQMIGVRLTDTTGPPYPGLQLLYAENMYSPTLLGTSVQLSNAFNGFPYFQPGQFVFTVSGTTASLYYNVGNVVTLIGTCTVPASFIATYLTVGGPLGGNQGWQGSLNCAAVYPSALTLGRLQDHFAAGLAAYDTNFIWFLMGRVAAYAGLPSWATSLPSAGVSRVDTFTLDGQTPLEALQAYEQTDGGVLYENAAGQLAYQDRSARYAAQASTATILTLAAGQYEPDYLPSATDQFLQNDSTVATPLIAGGVRALNAASILDYGTYANGTPQSPVSGPYYSLPNSGVVSPGRGSDVIADAASWNVGVNCQPGPRSPKVTVDLLTAPGDGLSKAAVYAAEIGTAIELAGTPSQAPGGTRASYLMIEGVTETFSITADGAEDLITFNTSPSMRSAAWIAGDSAMGVLDSTAVVGRGTDGGTGAGATVGPPYTVPSFSTGMNLTGNVGADDMRGLWFNVQQQVTPPIAMAVQIANAQSVANATNTDVIWDTLYYDTAVGWTLQTGNAWYTVQVAGVYKLAACVLFAPNSTGDRTCWFQQNGAQVDGQEDIPNSGSVYTGCFATATITAAVGDQLKVSCWQSSGGALSTGLLNGGSTFSIIFQGT